MNSGRSSPAPRNTPTSGSRTSSSRTRRRPRPNVGDRVLIASSSGMRVNVDERYEEGSDNADVFSSVDKETVSEAIRRSKDLPKMRNKIFEESLESQEVSFYIDDDTDVYYDKLDTQYECDSTDSFDAESDNEAYENFVVVKEDIGNIPLPEPPIEETYGIVKLARNFKRMKKNFSKDLGKSFRRFSQRMSTYMETDVREQTREERPAPISHVAEPTHNRVRTVEEPQHSESFLNKIRRSIHLSPDTAANLTSKIEHHSRSTFYLSESFEADGPIFEVKKEGNNSTSASSISSVLNAKLKLTRPTCPPPPVPENKGRDPTIVQLRKSPAPSQDKAKSLYSEAGLFKNNNYQLRNTTTSWYAESGLYPKSSNSSASSTKSFNNQPGYASVINELSLKLSTSALMINKDKVNTINEYSSSSVKSESSDDKPRSDYNRESSNESDNYNGNDYSYYQSQSVCSYTSSDSKKDDSSVTYAMSEIRFLEDEPLYQFYDANVLKSMYSDEISDFDSDIYEDIGFSENNEEYISSTPTPPARRPPPPVPPEPPSRIGVTRQNSITFARSLWCEVPEVMNSAVLSQLSSHQKKLQEAKFEIITSEASYLNSLNVLKDHFVSSFKKSNIVNEKEMDILFGKIKLVRNCSKKILHDLEKCWQKNILLDGICDIVQKHAEEKFDVYISYCENQVLIGETLNAMKERQDFQNLLVELESSVSCQFLSLYSFLMLPMQRITRWPLLVDAILKRLAQGDPEYLTCQYALASLNKIVNQCNEAARKKEREIELSKISEKLEFPRTVPFMDIVSPNRWLIKSGSVVCFQTKSEDTKMTLGRRFNKIPLELFMFNDFFIVAKKKSTDSFTVLHYCLRSLIELRSIDLCPLILRREAQDKNVLYVAILENHEGNLVELLLSCPTETEKERWIEALSPPKSENPDETVYECWDCPQVVAIHQYAAEQPDELSLAPGDVINVLRKMNDGWYNGERLRDGQTGWFPSNYTNEIINPHVRARNIKQRYRLLTFSEHYLKS